MGRWAVGLFVGICVVALAACDHSSPAAREGPRIAGVRFQVATAVDPGVMRAGPAPTTNLNKYAPTTADGLRLTLDRCELDAPGTWTFSGRVVMPHGTHDVTATLNLGFAKGDVGQSTWAHRVTFTKSGSFGVAVPGPTPAEGDSRSPIDDGVTGCEANLGSVSAPVATRVAFHSAGATRAPFEYDATSGSIQALGIGAPMGKPYDPRTVSLYTVWSAARSPIRDVYVPVMAGERPALLSIKPALPICTAIAVGIGPATGDPANQVTVTTKSRCGSADDDQSSVDTHQPVDGAPGFTWWRPAYPRSPWIAKRSVGTDEVWVQGGTAITRDRVAHIAATLMTLRNTATP